MIVKDVGARTREKEFRCQERWTAARAPLRPFVRAASERTSDGGERTRKNIETYIVNQAKISAVTLARTMRAALGRSQPATDAHIRAVADRPRNEARRRPSPPPPPPRYRRAFTENRQARSGPGTCPYFSCAVSTGFPSAPDFL